MVADIFNCPVVCPGSSEAGAMGAALQAMWCYLGEKESPVSLEALTDQYLALDESTRAQPEMSRVAQYADVYRHYLQLNDVMQPLMAS